MPDEINSVINAVSYRKEAVQFSAFSVMSLFARFWRNLWNSNKFCIFIIRVTLIKIVNTPPDKSAVLVLSINDWTYCSYTGIRQIQQIRLKIWPEPDLDGLQKNGWISDLPEPESKSGATL